MQARAAEDLKKLVTDRLVDAGLVYEGAKAFVTPRRLALAVAGRAGAPARPQGGAQGPARRRAREARSRASCKAAGLVVDRRGHDPEGPEEGRLLRRGDREARPRRDRRDRRDRCRGRAAHLPVAEVDALGRAVGEARRLDLGAPAAFHRRDVRAGDRGARDRARSRSTASRGQHHLRPSLHGAGRRSRCAASTTTWPSSRRPRSCSIRRAAREIILHDAKNLAFAQGYELVEDEGLLDEVAGLVEWPVVLMGSFDGVVPRQFPAR